jgi:two-component system sensor histidine kinase KdpD
MLFNSDVAENDRPNPDALLASLQRDEAARKRGRLKVFLGMCPGVGKTYAMLEAGQRELKAGRRVAIGYVETHGRKETDALTQGLTQVPRCAATYRGVTFTEMDLDAVLAQRLELVLVDELAHTNTPESRHPKRWQDVQELLDAGMDVFTTVNVQHIESRAEIVRQVTGAEMRETVPDSVLDHAVLELVDLPPAELMRRLQEGKVYLPDRAAAAAQNFFREANLTALRELALRLVADHVGSDTRQWRRSQPDAGTWKTGHCLLVAVGPSPASASLIRWTRQMADSLHCRWLAVHVESSRPLPEPAQAQLTRNLATARELGAEVITTSDEHLVQGLLRVAREQNATQIVVGKPGGTGLLGWLRASRLLRRLTRESGDIDLHVVRAERLNAGVARVPWRPALQSNRNQYLLSASVIAGTGAVNLLLQALAGPRVPGLVFLLAVVVLALFVGRGPVLLAGALSALGWNYFFLPPRFTFVISRVEDVILFGTYFVVAVVLGQLVARIRAQGEAERQREERATALYELMRNLASASSRDELVWHLIAQVNRVFSAPAAVCLPSGSALAAHPDSTLNLSEKDLGVAQWALERRQSAGRFTDNLPGANALHLPLATDRKSFGVLSVNLPGTHLGLAPRELLETFASQAALVLERVELRAAAAQASLVAESERLGRALLNSISHELRTPLAASTSAVSSLLETESPELRRALLAELQEANARLNRIVGNLLDVARLEAGNVRPRLDWHDVRDLVQATARDLRRELAGHELTLDLPSEPVLARVDFSLIQHALANLLLNAAAHTPPGTPIAVHAETTRGELVLSVADRGAGIPADVLPRIFDKFYRGPDAVPGGSGLGLTIARGFVEAHGGRISGANRQGGGAVFIIQLPQPEKPAIPGTTL